MFVAQKTCSDIHPNVTLLRLTSTHTYIWEFDSIPILSVVVITEESSALSAVGL